MDEQDGDGGTPRVGAAAVAPTKPQRYSWSPAAIMAELQLGAAVRSIVIWRWPPWRGCPTRRALPAVCVAAAVAAAVIVLSTGWGYSPNDLPSSWFSDGDDPQGSEPPWNLTAVHLIDGLLTADFSYGSCRSRYEFAGYHKNSSHKPSPYLLDKLREQEALQKRCGPGTAAYQNAVRRLDSGESVAGDGECRYLVYISFRGLGNRMLSIASAFLYAVLTERVLLVDGGGEDIAALFCEPFPGTTWLLPRAGWWSRSPLRRLRGYEGGAKESLGNMLQIGGAVAVSADGNVSWSAPRPPPYLYLNLAGGYGFHDKLFFCGAHQRLLRAVPWLFMWTDNYLVPGLFLTPPFRGELEAMFPEKDAAFHHLGRYLFHPTNPVWHAVKSYYRASLAGAGPGPRLRPWREAPPGGGRHGVAPAGRPGDVAEPVVLRAGPGRVRRQGRRRRAPAKPRRAAAAARRGARHAGAERGVPAEHVRRARHLRLLHLRVRGAGARRGAAMGHGQGAHVGRRLEGGAGPAGAAVPAGGLRRAVLPLAVGLRLRRREGRGAGQGGAVHPALRRRQIRHQACQRKHQPMVMTGFNLSGRYGHIYASITGMLFNLV